AAMIVQAKQVTFDRELKLQSGARLGPITLAYETYGTLNKDRSNAILVLHALSGDAHAAGRHAAGDKKTGWWDEAIGPQKAFDTDKYFIVCSNVLGGCRGSTGPGSLNPATGKPYAMSFPVVTMADMVEAQVWLTDQLGVGQWLCVTGGSMGGMQALQWTVSQPARVKSAIVLASTARVSAQSIALNEVPRQAIYADPHWVGGNYYGKAIPKTGLAVARMIGHITYLSETSMRAKFGRRLQRSEKYGYEFAAEFEVESYLKHQGALFTERFDANSFLYLTKAIDYFDLGHTLPSLAHAFRHVKARFLILSYSSDWLYPPAQSEELVRALLKNGSDATYMEIQSDYGHDSFLLETGRLAALARDFLARTAKG
ncbi:MAG: homoserine O-acetyltransferase, partial [Kiritimatiellaeota bacterium]|nr:homoserine O-acetyltransferase [Kiritimatiellota bacterium]